MRQNAHGRGLRVQRIRDRALPGNRSASSGSSMLAPRDVERVANLSILPSVLFAVWRVRWRRVLRTSTVCIDADGEVGGTTIVCEGVDCGEIPLQMLG